MAQSDELVASTVVCEVLRCERGDETRIYNLRGGSGGAELWRVTEISGEAASAVKECGFKTPEEAAEFLDEVRRTLRVAGWKEP
jgi:hypothetical protein